MLFHDKQNTGIHNDDIVLVHSVKDIYLSERHLPFSITDQILSTFKLQFSKKVSFLNLCAPSNIEHDTAFCKKKMADVISELSLLQY